LRQGVSVARVASLLTLFFRPTAPANFREAKECDREAFNQFFHRVRDAGVLLPPSQFEAWFISAAHDDAAIDATLAAASGTV
jgi:glutamate-1-semialdehyde 2,1-aminomutase